MNSLLRANEFRHTLYTRLDNSLVWESSPDTQDYPHQVNQEYIPTLGYRYIIKYYYPNASGSDVHLLGMADRLCYFIYSLHGFVCGNTILQEEVSQEIVVKEDERTT